MEAGIQVSSLKPLLFSVAGVDMAFGKIARMGVGTVQLQWIDRSVPPSEIAALLEKWGLNSVSVQDLYTTVREDLDYYVELNRLTGGHWLCISRIPEAYRSANGLECYAEELIELQHRLEPLGQRLCFHPVRGDFEPVEGIEPVSWLMERLPWLELCPDLYHLARAGKNLSDWLRRYEGRVCMVHFKDSRFHPDGSEQLVPAGQGDINWTGTVKTCLETGVPYAFVEQERWDRDPYDCLDEALSWLRGEMEECI